MPSNLDEQFQTIHELARAARRNLSDGPWDYLIGGTETETTVKRNRLAIDSFAFRPRVLRDVSKVDSSSTFFGRPVRLPVMLAPVGSVESFTPGGGATAAKASGAFGVPHMLSSACNPGLEATAKAADNYRIFQLYVRGDDTFVDDHVKRAKDNGYTLFCMTVDSAHYSRRERDIDKRFVKPWRQAATGMSWQAALSWDQVKRFKDTHDIPLILKVIATAEDAAIACEHGVDGVYVSNHGGRQLDHGVGSLAVLPVVVKAIVLGAQIVGLGRLQCLGLAAAGQAGLERALELLEEEVRICLALLGVTSYGELDASYVREAPVVAEPDALSAFPLL